MTARDGIYLSKKELNQFQIINEYLAKRVTWVDAALALNCTVRTVSRLAKSVKQEGLGGVVHGNYKKIPWNKLGAGEADRMKSLMLGKYQNFNVTQAHEILTKEHRVKIGYSKLRSLCHSVHAVKKVKRRAKPRHYRQRHAAEARGRGSLTADGRLNPRMDKGREMVLDCGRRRRDKRYAVPRVF